MTGATITMFLVKLAFLLSLINIAHSQKIFGKSLKSNCEEELCFSLGFLIFRYNQALQASSQIQEEEDEWRRQMISAEIRREEFDSQIQQFSPEKVSREVSQKRKTGIKRKRKSEVGHGDMTIHSNDKFLEPTRSSI